MTAYISDVKTVAPAQYKTDLQRHVYEMLAKLDIPFRRVDCDDAITMEDCEAINAALDMKTVKTLLLCNRQQTAFYLFVTAGDKPFITRDFSHALDISRVSFAPAELLLSMLHTPVGAATILSLIVDNERRVNLVIDRDVIEDEWFGCSDGTTSGYMKIRTSDLIERFLPALGRKPIIVTV